MWENPVFVKELRSKFRGRQHPRTLAAMGFVALGVIAWLYWEAISYIVSFSAPKGATDFWWMAFVLQAVIIWTIAPGLAANAISQEREQQTWDMLLCSPLTPHEIVLGKLAARSLPLLAIFGAFLPFLVYSSLVSDIQATQMIVGLALLVCWAFFLISTSLYASWSSRHSRVATAVAYLITFLPIIGVAAVNSVLSISGAAWQDTPIWWLSPFRAGEALYQLPSHLGTAETVLLFHLAAYGGVGAACVARMILGFRRQSNLGQ
ncbi:MAG: ABC transporter permease [Chthonomonadales bacterium]